METTPEIADVQMTSVASPPTPPPNFNVQLSDGPVQRAASWVRKVVPSGMAAVPVDESIAEEEERTVPWAEQLAPSDRAALSVNGSSNDEEVEADEEGDRFMTPVQTLNNIPITPTLSESQLTATTGVSRIPPRDWHSNQGIPSPPANTDRANSLRSSVVTEQAGPVERHAIGLVPDEMLRSISQDAQSEVPSLDMEAEIRRRRMKQTSENQRQQGGWYNSNNQARSSQDPRYPASSSLGGPILPRGRDASYSTIAANEVVGTTPWAARQGLGLSMNDQVGV
jgi:hypothetical protein